MIDVDIFIHADRLIPMVPEHCVLEKHTVVIQSGGILDILPTDKAKQIYAATKVYDLKKHVVMPGLVNAHTHSPMSLLRGIADDLPLMEWLTQHIWPIEKRCLNEDFIKDGTELAVAEMIRAGTTCVNEHYFFPDFIASVIKKTGLRACLGLPVMDAKTAWAESADEYLDKGLSVMKDYKNEVRLSFSLAPHAPYTLSDRSLLKMKAYELPIHMHVHETQDEIKESLARYQKRPLKRLYDLGLLSSRFQAVHMTQVDEEDMAILKEKKLHVVHCPSSNLKLASGFCPVQKMVEEGVNIALGTDGAASNNNLDLFKTIYLAAILGKAVSQNSMAVSAMQALKMATINGAKALGLSDKIGSIEKGKRADLIAVDMSDFNTRPLFNPISNMVYSMNSRQVSHVFVEGRILLKEGELTTLNKKAILEKVSQWRQRLATPTCN